MSNNASYIITTLSSSVQQRKLFTTTTGNPQAPFRFGPFGAQHLRLAGKPYVVVAGGSTPDETRLGSDDWIINDGTIDAGGKPYGITALATYTIDGIDTIDADGEPLYDLTLVPGEVTLSMDQISGSGNPYNLSLIPGGVTASSDLISGDGRPYGMTVVPGGVTSSVSLIGGDGRPYGMTIIPGGVTSSVSLIDGDGRPYNAGLSEASSNTYTAIVSASNPNNTTAMHVGSLYLDARTYTTIGALITDIKGGVGGSNVHVELRKFTNGVALMSASNTSTAGPTWRYATASSVVVSTNGWYDIYISASGNPATSSIRGIFYEY